MLLYVLRALKSRSKSLLLAVLGLGVALGALLSVLRTVDLLETGTPRGTQLSGPAFSVFMHSDAMRFDFFLGPRQIEGLQDHFGDAGYVIGSAGARSLSVSANGQPGSALVDVVSRNFFKALEVEIDGIDASAWGDAEPTALVSARWLRRNGLDDPPTHLRVGPRLLPVAGVVPVFTGLWDQSTEIWVDWRLGPELLFPSVANVSVADQPWFYWTLALPQSGRQAEFEARSLQGFARRDLVEPPFETFRAVPGITNQPDARRTADDSIRLYLFVAWLGVLASAVNLACWCALSRIVKADAEWTMLCLGISRARYRSFEVAFVLVPVVIASLLALPIALGFDLLVASDPAVASLMSQAADLRASFPWTAHLSGGVVLFLAVYATSKIVARAAGLRFGSATLGSDSERVRVLFRTLTVLMSTLASLALLVGFWAARSSLDLWREAQERPFAGCWVMQVKATDDQGKRMSLFPEDRSTLVSSLTSELPEVSQIGFSSTRPYSDARIPLTEFRLSKGGSVSILVNEVDGAAIEALGAGLRAGSLPLPGSQGLDIVVDTGVAAVVARASGAQTAIGSTLSDAAGMGYTIVGVVDRLPYSSDLSHASAVGYIPMGSAPPALNLVLRGALGERRIRDLMARPQVIGEATIALEAAQRLDLLADRAMSRYLARVTFCLATAAATLLIGIMSIGTIVLVETQRGLRRIAIMSALGATHVKIVSNVCRGIILSVASGAVLGSAAALVLAGLLQGLFLMPAQGLLASIWWPAPMLAGVALVGSMVLVRKTLGRVPLYQHLRSD